MKQFEYKTVFVGSSVMNEKSLNEYGNTGWELTYMDNHKSVFKREKKFIFRKKKCDPTSATPTDPQK